MAKKDSIYIKINSISILILVFITAFYAYQTFKLTSISTDQMLLSVEPNIELESENFNKMDSGRVHFLLLNQSPVELKNIKLYSKYYTHIIDSELNEYFLHRGIKTFAPDSTINEIGANGKVKICFDYKRSGLLEHSDNSSFYVGTLENPIEVPMNKLNKFHNMTFSEITIEYQRQLDGKIFSRQFYYLIALPYDSLETIFIRNTKDMIIDTNREASKMSYLIRRRYQTEVEWYIGTHRARSNSV